MGHELVQGSREDAAFFDSSVFEAAEPEDPESLKRFLRQGLKNTSVTCVLIGATTALSRWVRYEILRSFIGGNRLLAIRIHSIPSFNVSPPFQDLIPSTRSHSVWLTAVFVLRNTW